MAGQTTHSYSVEKGVAHDLQLNLDIIVAMRCSDLHINVQDASGDRVLASQKLRKDDTLFAHWGQGSLLLDKKTGERRHKDVFTGPSWMKDQVAQYQNQEDVHEYLGKARARRKWAATPKLRRGEEADSCRIFGSVEGNKVQGDFHITARGHGYAEWGTGHLGHDGKCFLWLCQYQSAHSALSLTVRQRLISPTISTSFHMDLTSPGSPNLWTEHTQ